MPHNRELPKNHISKVSSAESKEQINRRFSLLERCTKGDIEITDDLLELLETDKNLLSFSGKVSDISLLPVARNTVKNHGKLTRLQTERIRARESVTIETAVDDTSDTEAPKHKKDTKASLKADKVRLQDDLNQRDSELATLRSAYRELLKEINAKLPNDRGVAAIVENHNKASVIRDRVHLRVVK
ncbi:hypothetical protein AB4559_03280 [Vibrio sp. 10N.222.51.C8]|uniref:hypothetical protein n=1 Tax=Vibrio sp. 10N.222.51.C8 TaxID=3229624 RepID=UPI00354DA422